MALQGIDSKEYSAVRDTLNEVLGRFDRQTFYSEAQKASKGKLTDIDKVISPANVNKANLEDAFSSHLATAAVYEKGGLDSETYRGLLHATRTIFNERDQKDIFGQVRVRIRNLRNRS